MIRCPSPDPLTLVSLSDGPGTGRGTSWLISWLSR